MSEEKREALTVYIMILSALKMVDKPNATVSKAIKYIFGEMRRRYLKSKKGTSVKVADQEYVKINEIVIEAWDNSKRSHIEAEGVLDASLAELLMFLWNRMRKNKYQKMFIGESRMMKIINSITDSHTSETRTAEEMVIAHNNARDLADTFLNNCGIKKQHVLSTRKKIIEQNLIIERG